MKKYLMLFNIILLVICFSSCGVQKIKDEDAAYDIIHTWLAKYNPISDKDAQFCVESGASFQLQNIEGDDYYSCEINVFYKNKNYRVMSGDIYKNAVAGGIAYVRIQDGAIYVEFDEGMEPIEEWHDSFDNWVVSVAPVGYDKFITAPILNDFINLTDYYNYSYGGDGWTYELIWDYMDIAQGYEIEYTEISPWEDSEPYKTIYDQEENYLTVGASVPIEVTVRVRAYIEEDGERIYGAWSEPSSIVFGSDDPPTYWNVTWQDLMRYPESYIDEFVQLSEVTVLQDAGSNIYRVWDNNLKVYVINTSDVVSGVKILEGDKLWIRGKYVGIKTFNMTNGSTEDYPYIMVDYYEIMDLYGDSQWDDSLPWSP